MSKRTTTVSLRGDEAYKQAVTHVAGLNGVDVGELVRIALDKQFGHEIKPFLDFFCAQRESKNSHMGTRNNNHRPTKS